MSSFYSVCVQTLAAPRDRVTMDTRPSQNVDFRARNRAKKRYRQVGEHWVKGKEIEGAWVPAAASKKFASVGEAVEHEMSLTKQRRATWTNLIKGRCVAKDEELEVPPPDEPLQPPQEAVKLGVKKSIVKKEKQSRRPAS